MLIVDTNVLVDVLEDDPNWAEWSVRQLHAQAQVHELVINPIIHAEQSLALATVEALDAVVGEMRLTVVDVPRPALFLAGQAFLRCRRAPPPTARRRPAASAPGAAARCRRSGNKGSNPRRAWQLGWLLRMTPRNANSRE